MQKEVTLAIVGVEKDIWGNGPGGYVFSGKIRFSIYCGVEAGPYLLDWTQSPHMPQPEATTKIIADDEKGLVYQCRIKFPSGMILQFRFAGGQLPALSVGNECLEKNRRRFTNYGATLS